MSVIDGATHMNFGGNGPGADQVTPMVTSTVTSFLNGARKSSCALPQSDKKMVLQAK